MSANSNSKPRASLPPKLIIGLGKFVWTRMWHIMMSKLAPRSRTGEYKRPESEFRHWISKETNSPHPPASERYQLIVGMSCPWAHRTLVVRALKGLQDCISVCLVYPDPLAGGWVFEEEKDGCRRLADFYQKLQPGYTGRATVPVLWDKEKQAIVNNESAEIIVMLNAALNEFAQNPDLNLYPESLQTEIDTWNQKIYETVNNGVYRCGFAQTQQAYDRACADLFATLDEVESILATRRYLCGDKLTLADVRLFTTLLRFDVAYYGLFKCNRRRIRDYQHLSGYLRDIYQLPGVRDTCDREQVKRDYYGNLFPLNPGQIIPAGPDMEDLLVPHNRELVETTVKS